MKIKHVSAYLVNWTSAENISTILVAFYPVWNLKNPYSDAIIYTNHGE